MNFYDLTHTMHSGMPVYPGKPQPSIFGASTLEKEGYRELRIEMDGHTGTHMDAPAHMLEGGRTLDNYPVSAFSGNALVVTIPEGTRFIGVEFLKEQVNCQKGERQGTPPAALESRGEETATMAGAKNEITGKFDFLLINTGWGKKWGDPSYMASFPVLTEEAARWLVSCGIKGIGLDAISVDPVESESWPVHHILFEGGLVIVENLVFPSGFHHTTCQFHCFPLSIEASDGSPVRAVAFA